MFAVLFSLLSAFLFLTVNAASISRPTELIAFAPTINSPNAKSVWLAGYDEDVTWETTNVPTEAQGYTLTIKLGYLLEGSTDEHLYTELASGIPIMQGKKTVSVPSDLQTGSDYIIVVIGDSGDRTSQFSIISPDGPSLLGL